MQVLLGISSGIAAYKTPGLVRLLRQAGHEVRCVLTPNAGHLVGRDALATVSGHPVQSGLWHPGGDIPHIDLVRWCQVLVVAPCTAHRLACFALGLAPDLLATAFLALEPDRPVILAPAMNTVMWRKPIVQSHIASLRAAGATIVGPVEGRLACGEEGVGAMADPSLIVEAVAALR